MTINRGLVHSFLGQTWDYSEKGKVRVAMEGKIGQMVEDYGKGGSAATQQVKISLTWTSTARHCQKTGGRGSTPSCSVAWVAKRIVPQLWPALSFLMPRVGREETGPLIEIPEGEQQEGNRHQAGCDGDLSAQLRGRVLCGASSRRQGQTSAGEGTSVHELDQAEVEWDVVDRGGADRGW